MKLTWKKIKLSLAMICIGSMAFFTGVPIMPQEKVAKILKAHNSDVETEVIQAGDEQF